MNNSLENSPTWTTTCTNDINFSKNFEETENIRIERFYITKDESISHPNYTLFYPNEPILDVNEDGLRYWRTCDSITKRISFGSSIPIGLNENDEIPASYPKKLEVYGDVREILKKIEKGNLKWK